MKKIFDRLQFGHMWPMLIVLIPMYNFFQDVVPFRLSDANHNISTSFTLHNDHDKHVII